MTRKPPPAPQQKKMKARRQQVNRSATLPAAPMSPTSRPAPLAPPPIPSAIRRIARGLRLGFKRYRPRAILRGTLDRGWKGIVFLSVIASLAAAYYYFQPAVSIDVGAPESHPFAASANITNLNFPTLYDLHAQIRLREVTSIGAVGVPPVTVQLWFGGLGRPEYLPSDNMAMVYSQIQASNPRPTIILKPAPGDSIALSTLKEWSASKMPQYGKLTIRMEDIASLLPQPATAADFVLAISYWSYIPLRSATWRVFTFQRTATWKIFTRPRQGGGVDWLIRPDD